MKTNAYGTYNLLINAANKLRKESPDEMLSAGGGLSDLTEEELLVMQQQLMVELLKRKQLI